VIFPSADGKDPLPDNHGGTSAFAISPIDHNLLCVFQGSGSSGRLQHSRDGGATWQTTFGFSAQALCVGWANLLLPHPVDARVVFSDLSCQASRDFGAGVMGLGPAQLFRSDNDGATWTTVFQADDRREWSLHGLAFDPTSPDTVWIALGFTPNPAHTGVRVSYDAGHTWDFLGRQDIGWVRDLVRTTDGTALLAATSEGIWRYALLTLPDERDSAYLRDRVSV
jgi:photosystem II stability/assembly factor-like uncharacterized protein